MVPNQGRYFSLALKENLPSILWADLEKSSYSWHQCSGTVYNHDRKAHKMSKHYSGYLHPKWSACSARSAWIFCVCPKLCSANSVWFKKKKKTWAHAWRKWPSHVDTSRFAHVPEWGVKELSLHSPCVHLHKKSKLQIFHL